MTYSFHIVATQTGISQIEVFPATGSWSRVLNAGGKGSHSFVLAGPDPSTGSDDPMEDHGLTEDWARTLVVSWDGVVVYAGVIVKRVWDDANQVLTVEHEDIRSLFSRRFPFGTAGYWAPGTSETQSGLLTLTALSLRASIIRIMQESLTGPFPSKWALPIDLPPFAAEGGGNTEAFENFNFMDTASHLQNFQERDGGPDTDFEGYWVGGAMGGTFRWSMRIGSPAAPSLSGSLYEFNQSVPEPRLTGLKVTHDGQKRITGQFSIGTGSGRDMKVGGAGLGNAAVIPALDVTQLYKEQADKNILASYAGSAIAVQGVATTQYSFGLLATEEPGLAALRIGSIFRLMFSGNRWLPDGNTDLRVIRLSGDMTVDLGIEVQPWG